MTEEDKIIAECDAETIESLRAQIAELKGKFEEATEERDSANRRGDIFKENVIELKAENERLKALSVTSIMIAVVPGDGSGHEVYAKSVADVEALLSRLSEKAEDYDLETRPLRKERDKLKRQCEEMLQAREFDSARTGVLARLVNAAWPDNTTVQLECIGTILGSIRIAVEGIIKERDEYKDDAERLNYIAGEYIKIDSFCMPTGQGDADVGWTLSQYYMQKPTERVVHKHYSDNLRAAIDAAMKGATE